MLPLVAVATVTGTVPPIAAPRPPPAGAALAPCCLHTHTNRSANSKRMITQIHRWRRFFVESTGGCPRSECETERGWSIAFFFAYFRLRALSLIGTFSHI